MLNFERQSTKHHPYWNMTEGVMQQDIQTGGKAWTSSSLNNQQISAISPIYDTGDLLVDGLPTSKMDSSQNPSQVQLWRSSCRFTVHSTARS